MKTPIVLLLLSLVASGVGLMRPDWSDVLMVSLPCSLASLWLLWRAWRNPLEAHEWVILDGSNVMHWQRGVPSLDPVRDVLVQLAEQGFTAGVMFDANAGYKLGDRYQSDRALSARLKLPVDRVMVVPSGTPADPYILAAARDYGARIVSNDQFRDWAEEFPEVSKPGFLISGNYRNGALQLHLD